MAAYAPQVSTQALVVAGTKNTTTSIVGTTAAYASVNAFDIWQGRFLTDASNDYDLREAVLGGTTADDLGLGATSIGSHHHDRRPALPGRGHPPDQGQRRSDQPGRPGADPA